MYDTHPKQWPMTAALKPVQYLLYLLAKGKAGFHYEYRTLSQHHSGSGFL